MVQATGPCALTAALQCFSCSSINISLPAPPVIARKGGGCAHAAAEGGEQRWTGEEGDAAGVGDEEEEEDIFSQVQMEALIERILCRLSENGYPVAGGKRTESSWAGASPAAGSGGLLGPASPSAEQESSVSGEGGVGSNANGRRREYGPSKVFIYPPSAFYVIHWRENPGLVPARTLTYFLCVVSPSRACLHKRDILGPPRQIREPGIVLFMSTPHPPTPTRPHAQIQVPQRRGMHPISFLHAFLLTRNVIFPVLAF